MHLESIILAEMSTRKGYNRLRTSVQLTSLAKEVQVIIKSLGRYYKRYEHDEICLDTFRAHFFQLDKKNGEIKEDERAIYHAFIDRFTYEVDEESSRQVIKQCKELDFSVILTDILTRYERGGDVSVYDEVDAALRVYKRELRSTVEELEVTDSIEDILEELEAGTAFHWTNLALNAAMPDMRSGDQVIFAARPGTGKTSFVMFEVCRMAPHLPEGRPIIWFCNEGNGKKIRLAKYRSVCQCNQAELVQIGGEATRQIVEEGHCGEERFRIFNVHGKSVYDLESIIEEHNPAIVVWDMLDNVKGFSTENRTDLRLEELYKWARDMAVIHDFLSIPTSQTSDLAEGLPWPSQNMLKDSRTGKQGACDAIVVMGMQPGPEHIRSRYISIAKAWKGSPKPGADPTARCCVTFEFEKCMFSAPSVDNLPSLDARN